MNPVYIFTAVGYMLFAARSWIIGLILVGLCLGMFTTAGLIAKALVNNAVAAVGMTPPFLLPPNSMAEAASKVAVHPGETSSRGRTYNGDAFYTITTTGTLTNRGPWTYDEVQVKCYYKTVEADYEKAAKGFQSIDLKPGQTISYSVNVDTEKGLDKSGMDTAQCKVTPKAEHTAFIKD